MTRKPTGYAIKQVMGPDEFHSHADNNAFTNPMPQWTPEQPAQVHSELSKKYPNAMAVAAARIGLLPEEVDQRRACRRQDRLPSAPRSKCRA